ncbi:MAG: uroporphyrinogen-III synthase, partial [Alphaproteobacteria bacterium]|nr:uroporphyrinogen-III synthase [Alphaproteobacteria bacterium]
MTRLLILRPEPGASATAARAAALGFEAIPAPLFNIEPRAWPPVDPATLDAVMMTSANAARLGGSLLPAYWHLPLFAVGMATAQAACAAGFSSIHTGAGDVVALAEILRDHGMGRVLHLCGEDHHVPDAPWV